MAEKIHPHETNVEITQSAPAEVDAGVDMALKVKVTCVSGCDFQGKPIQVLDQDGAVLTEVELVTSEKTANETAEFSVRAPVAIGAYAWQVAFPAEETGDVPHAASSAPLAFKTKQHSTSLAVWDHPSPILKGASFKIKVGPSARPNANSRAGKSRFPTKRDRKWEREFSETHRGRGRARSTGSTWNSSLRRMNVYTWTCTLPPAAGEIPHDGASSKFSFKTVRPPEHVVTVRVTAKETKAPLKGAEVFLHPYRASTDENGVAKLEVPKGEFEVYVTLDGYTMFKTTVNAIADVSTEAELYPAPPSPY